MGINIAALKAAAAGAGSAVGASGAKPSAQSTYAPAPAPGGYGAPSPYGATFPGQGKASSPYGAAPAQPSPYGAAPGQPSPYGTAPGQPTPYGAAPGQPSPYGAAPGQPSPYGAPPGQPTAYGSQPGQPSPYGAPSGAAPNPYAPSAPGAPAGYGAPAASTGDEPKILQLNQSDRQYAIKTVLPGRDYWIATDESASMNARDCNVGGRKISRWEALGERASQIAATAEKYDPNGLTWIRFGSDAVMKDNVKASEILSAFYNTTPSGATHMIKMLRLFRDSVTRQWQAGNRKPHSLLIFTDGEPTPERHGQDAKVECGNIIKELANSLRSMGGSDQDVAISFIQMGYDLNSSQFLNDLDNKLHHDLAGFDIVDTKHWDVIVSYQLTDDELILDGILD